MRLLRDPAELDFRTIVRPGDTVLWTQGSGEPTALLERLLAQRHEIGPFRMFLGTSYSGVVRPEHADVVRFIGLGAVGTNRAMCKAGLVDVLPCNLTDMPRMLATGALRADVVLLQLSAADASGRHSAGAMNSYVQAALPRCRAVVVEINDQAPWTHASEPFWLKEFEAALAVSRPLPELRDKPPGPVENAIAGHIAALVPDGATLQVGIGGIPNALFEALRGHRDLGLHTGVIGDGMLDLVERGVLTNARKGVDRGVSVTGGLLGTRRLYGYADRNPALRVEPVSYTHASQVLDRLDRLLAVNSALEVDLTGQIGAEVAGQSYVGTIGGQVDFARAALRSEGGRSVVGLPARTESGRPRIVARLASGVVTTARSDADVIVTEYGVAELRYQPVGERIRRMIAIAHPDDREALARAAREQVAGFPVREF